MEVWKDVVGYEGHYQVSNKGNVRSVDRSIEYISCKGNPSKRRVKGKLLGKHPHPQGYLKATLGHKSSKLIHRLVAEVFIKNPNGYSSVNHIDGDKKNNSVSNLEWVSHQQNMIHAVQVLNIPCGSPKKVIGIKVADGTTVEFSSQTEAEKALSQTGKTTGAISLALSGKTKSAYGYVWRCSNA